VANKQKSPPPGEPGAGLEEGGDSMLLAEAISARAAFGLEALDLVPGLFNGAVNQMDLNRILRMLQPRQEKVIRR